MKLSLFKFLIVLLTPFSLFSAKWYVNNNSTSGDFYCTAVGAGGNTGASPSSPKLTLSSTIALVGVVNGDTIYVDKGSFIELNLNVNKSLTIIGAGPGNTIFTGNATVNRFATFAANNIVLKNVTLRNYYDSNDGQVITMSGRTGIVLDNVVVKDNQGNATSGANIAVLASSNATFTNCLFSCSGWNSDGGGTILVNSSTIVVTKCIFKDVRNFADYGGAIEIRSSSTVTVTNSTFDECSARRGGAIYQNGGTLTVSNSCFQNNFSAGDGSDPLNGGGAYANNGAAGTSCSFSNCRFTNNSVNRDGDQNASSDGGAILFRSANGTFNFDQCSFSGNSVSSADKGQDFYLDESTITGTINNCTFGASSQSSGSAKVNIYNNNLETADVTLSYSGTPTFTGTAFTGTGSNALAPTSSATATCSTAALANCGATVNCATETNPPVIVSCVPDKSITGTCSTSLLDYRAEVAAFDDCSFTIAQSPAAGTIISSGTTIVTMTLTDQAGNISTCTFNVTVSGTVVSAPIVGAITQPTCSVATGSVDLSGLPASGSWTLTPSIGAAVIGSGTTYTFTGLLASTNYTFTVTNSGGCVSPASSTVAIDAQPTTTTPTGSSTQTFCADQNSTVADLVAVGSSIQWYMNSSGGSPLTTSTNLLDNTHYYATQTVTGCESSVRLDILVIITPIPTSGTLSAGDNTLCSAATTTVSSTVSGGTWSSSDNLIATVDLNTGLVTAVAQGTVIMTYTVAGTAGCLGTDATATINIDVTQAPDAGTLSAGDNTLCSGTTTTTVSSTVPGGIWSSSDNAIATVDPNTGIVAAISGGTAIMTYTVAGTAGCLGSDATATINIDVTNAPTTGILSAGDNTLCSGTTTTVSSTVSGGTWSSSDNLIATVDLNTGLVTAVAQGTVIMTYTVAGTAGCLGTDATATINIDVTQSPDAGTLSAGDNTLCSGTTTTVSSTVPGGIWSSSDNAIATVDANSGLVTAISGGTAVMTYSVTGTGGCSTTTATATINIDVTQTPSIGTITPVGASLCLGSTSTMSSTVSGGTWTSSNNAVATIDLNTGLVTAIGVGTANITYTVLGTAACLGTDASGSVSINIISSPSAGTLSALDSSLCIGSTTIASSTSLGGTWISSNNAVATIDPNSGLVTAVGPGLATLTYTVVGTGSCVGANDSKTLDISVQLAPVAGSLSVGDSTLCSGSTTTASSTVSGGTWSSSNTAIATIDANTGLVTAISSGTATLYYEVFGTGDCIGTNAIDSIDVVVTSAPTTGTLTALDSTLCSGSTTTASSTVLGGTWISSDNSIATIDANTGLVTAISAGVATMSYTVLGTGACLGVDATGTLDISVTSAPTAGTLSALDNTLCSGSTTTVSSTIAGGTWSSSDNSIATVDSNTGLVTAIAAGTATMTYTVLGTGACLGVDATNTFDITVTLAPTAGTLSAGDNTLCSGSTTTVSSTISGGTWSSSDNLIATVDANTGLVTAIATGTATMTYTVLGTGACLGVDATATIDITVTTAPTAGTLSVLDATLCSGSTTTASSTVSGGTWSSLDNSIATIDVNTGLVTAISTGTATMTYTVLGAGACLGVDATGTIDVTVTSAPTAGTLSALDNTLCSGSTTTVSSTIAGGTWSSSDNAIATVDANTGLVTAISSGTATMTYAVLGTGACLGVDASGTIDVTVTTAATAGTLSVLDATLCSGSTTTASSTISGGTWSSSNNLIATIDANTGLVTTISSGTATMTYTVLGTGACLGVDATNTIDIQVIALPSAPSGDTIQYFCSTNNPLVSNLTTNPVNGITWYDSQQGGANIPNSTALIDGGQYYATQTINGCESSLTLLVNVELSSIDLAIVSQVISKCHKSDGSIEVIATNGIPFYSYNWSNGQSSSLIQNIDAGTYAVTVTDSIGCESSLSIEMSCTDSEIPTIITPNGNGKNENWILNLEPDAKVEIYNRWGNLVYSAKPYLDDWNGKANVSGTAGTDYLPSGTYFYIIDLNNGEKPQSGYIELVK